MIAEEFRERSELSVKDELFFIIFTLALRTKMRLGEIINLRRNCIADKDFGNIKYYSKTSGGNLVDAFLTEEMITLIEKAIENTAQYAAIANERIKHYIFLNQSGKRPDKRSNNIINKII